MFSKLLYISISFIASFFILFIALFSYKNDISLFKNSNFKDKSIMSLYKDNYPVKTTDNTNNDEHTIGKYQIITIKRENIPENTITEYNSMMLYMEKIKRDIASRKSILMHKLYLLEQEDRAVRAAFKRMLDRLRLERLSPPGLPATRDIHSHDKGSFEML